MFIFLSIRLLTTRAGLRPANQGRAVTRRLLCLVDSGMSQDGLQAPVAAVKTQEHPGRQANPDRMMVV